ncbi:outer membrane protein assembly factor BamB family protein [Actinoplanes friuliensis]|uniref:Pyrrolo-quinoline quinone repeat domain-containing protein n=1 Tax=Actinoplanes friuliensis DSM 7358 TaxID=1246995 RepID=U5W0E4_9ACTN|nr:PQQ-binding-like beta-propeller repeat protein [Actinoplanes friuliensis]AGZ41401.1 hypothetical protein AFR_15595 [Actinoplanes friuliensis DSM 7358]
MHRIVVSALACLTLAAAAVPAGAAPVTGPDASGASRLRMAWSVTPKMGVGTAPVYLAGSTYHLEGVRDPTNARSLLRVVRHDAGTGRALSFATGAIESIMPYKPVTSGSTLFVTTYREDTQIRAFRPDGRLLSMQKQPGQQHPNPPLLSGSLLITVSRSECEVDCKHTTVFGWRVSDGSPVWSYTLPGGYVKLTTTAGYAAVMINTLSTITMTSTNTMTVLDTTTGKPLWSRPVEGGSGFALDGKHAYVSRGSIRAYGIRDGEPAWTGADGGYNAVHTSPYGIFATSGDTTAAYDSTGRRRWWSRIHPRSTLTVDTGIVYFQQSPNGRARGAAYLAAMRASTGKLLSRTKISDGGSIGDVAVGGGRVFTKVLLERIVAFAPARR